MGGIGVGILLFVVGAILYWAWNGNIPGFDDDVLGMILMGVGVLAIVLALIMQAQRNRSRHVTETRYSDNRGNVEGQREIRRHD